MLITDFMQCVVSHKAFRYTLTAVHKGGHLGARRRWCWTQFPELQTEAQRGLACDHRIAHGTGGSPLRFPKREAWLSHNSTEQRAPVTCQPASQEPTAAAGRQQLQRGLSLLMFLSVLLPAEPTWHQKPTVTACWPEGRLCGGPCGPWSQCLRVFSVSSRRSLPAGLCHPRKFLKLVCHISSCLGPAGMGREDLVPASCDIPSLLLGISAPGNPPPPGWGRRAWAPKSWELLHRLCPPHLPPPCWAWTGHSFSIPRDAKGVPLPESLHLALWTDLPLHRESGFGGDGSGDGHPQAMLCQPRMGGQEVVLLFRGVGGGW